MKSRKLDEIKDDLKMEIKSKDDYVKRLERDLDGAKKLMEEREIILKKLEELK